MSRQCNIQHLIYASSSSVYGANKKTPFHENDLVRHPISFYAATKISNELMAHSYSHLFDLPVTGLRFFTVYGPWGRPDMSPLIFSRAIVNQTPIKLFAGGNMLRDFTYIDDVVRSIELLLDKPPMANESYDHALPVASSSSAPYAIFNVGNSNPIKVIDYVEMLQKAWNIDAIIENLPMQAGDVTETYAATGLLEKKIGFMPNTDLEVGLGHLVNWYRNYYQSSK
jgi:UDP-glucuronate 4-epimerase